VYRRPAQVLATSSIQKFKSSRTLDDVLSLIASMMITFFVVQLR